MHRNNKKFLKSMWNFRKTFWTNKLNGEETSFWIIKLHMIKIALHIESLQANKTKWYRQVKQWIE